MTDTQPEVVGTLLAVPKLYPRRKTSDYNVADLVRALEAGAELPPIVIDDKRRIVDGWHRQLAYMQLYGSDHKVQVEVRHYDSDADLFLDATRLNSAHGSKLTRGDEVNVTLLATELGAAEEDIAAALHVQVERIQELRVRFVIQQTTSEPMPTKLVVRHLEGQTVTETQAAAIDRGPGVAPLRIIGDLTAWLETGVLDLGNKRIRTALRSLAALIVETVGEEEEEEEEEE